MPPRCRPRLRASAVPAALALLCAVPALGRCDPGAIASPASFDGLVRPATAVDLDPDPDVIELALTARPDTRDFGSGVDTEVWTYDGALPGPVIEAKMGDLPMQITA